MSIYIDNWGRIHVFVGLKAYTILEAFFQKN